MLIMNKNHVENKYKMNRKYLHLLIKIYIFSEVFGDFSKPLDLTWYFENSTIYWSGVQPFIFTKKLAVVTQKEFWLAMNEFCAGEHGGTHMDAPYHFNKQGIKIGQIPVENLIVSGALIDISDEVSKNGSNTTLNIEHLLQWQKVNGEFEQKSILLVKFGWSKFYPKKELYLGSGFQDGVLEFPGISPEAAQWLVNSEKFLGIGVDVASIDPGFSSDFKAHQILNGNGLYLLENVKIVDKLPVRDFTLLAIPMNIAEGTGAPLRLIALPKGYL